MSSQNARRLSTSIATVGSSRNTRSGSPAIANANRTRWASPPDSVSARRFTRSARPARSRIAARGDGLGYRPRARSTSSPTLRPGRQAAPTGASRRPGRNARRRAVPRPSVRARPADGSSRPSMMPMAVVLPAPLGPSSATVSPLRDPERDVVEREGVAEAAADAVEGDGGRPRGGVDREMVVVAVVVMRRSSARDGAARSHGRRDRTVTTVTTGARDRPDLDWVDARRRAARPAHVPRPDAVHDARRVVHLGHQHAVPARRGPRQRPGVRGQRVLHRRARCCSRSRPASSRTRAAGGSRSCSGRRPCCGATLLYLVMWEMKAGLARLGDRVDPARARVHVLLGRHRGVARRRAHGHRLSRHARADLRAARRS